MGILTSNVEKTQHHFINTLSACISLFEAFVVTCHRRQDNDYHNFWEVFFLLNHHKKTVLNDTILKMKATYDSFVGTKINEREKKVHFNFKMQLFQ